MPMISTTSTTGIRMMMGFRASSVSGSEVDPESASSVSKSTEARPKSSFRIRFSCCSDALIQESTLINNSWEEILWSQAVSSDLPGMSVSEPISDGIQVGKKQEGETILSFHSTGFVKCKYAFMPSQSRDRKKLHLHLQLHSNNTCKGIRGHLGSRRGRESSFSAAWRSFWTDLIPNPLWGAPLTRGHRKQRHLSLLLEVELMSHLHRLNRHVLNRARQREKNKTKKKTQH